MYHKPLSLDIEQIKTLKAAGHSCKRIAHILGCSTTSVLIFARKRGITFTALKDNAQMSQFTTMTDPVIAYFLGYAWADGFLMTRRRKDGSQLYHGLAIQLRKDDGEYLFSLISHRMKVVAKDYKRVYTDGSTRLPQLFMYICDSTFANWLVNECDYDKKSWIAPTRMLAKVPKHLHPAFWLGYYDGDGTIDSPKHPRCVFTSSHGQDWSELKGLCDSIGITGYRLRQWVSKKGHQASSFTIGAKDASLRFLTYLYAYEGLGLERKASKYRDALSHQGRMMAKQKALDDQVNTVISHSHLTRKELAEKLGVSVDRIERLKTVNRRRTARLELLTATKEP